MTVFIQLTVAGANVGPFNLYSNLDLVTPFASAVSRAILVGGADYNVTNGTTNITVVSMGVCTNNRVLYISTTTTSTSTSSSTTSSSTTSTSTTSNSTTTTTTIDPTTCYSYYCVNIGQVDENLYWDDCGTGAGTTYTMTPGQTLTICARVNSVTGENFTIEQGDLCT